MAAVILTVDDEGFVYDPDPPETRKTNPLYWTPFGDITEVRPEGNFNLDHYRICHLSFDSSDCLLIY